MIGAGTMGGGIAICFANAGIPVTVIEVNEDALGRGLDAITKNYRSLAGRGMLSADEAERRIGLVTGTTDLAAVADADIVIEAAFEDMAVKRRIFADLGRLAKADAVLATNTSYLDVDAIAQLTPRPASVVGMHFFSPAPVMRLIEVVRAKETAPETLSTTIALARRIGKVPVVVGVCHGFVGNRMMRLRSVECERLLIEGALPREVDAAMTAFGFSMGPFGVMDLAGLDISWRMRKAQGARAPRSATRCARWAGSARRRGEASISTRRDRARRGPTRRWRRWSSRRRRASASRAAPSMTRRSSNGSCSR